MDENLNGCPKTNILAIVNNKSVNAAIGNDDQDVRTRQVEIKVSH